MSRTEKLQVLNSDVSNLKLLPQIITGFYVILIDDGWPTVASKVVCECHEVFSRGLLEHIVIVPGPQLRKLLRPIYNIDAKDDPTLIMTDIAPVDFDSKKHKENGLRISLSHLTDRNSIVAYLQQVVNTIKAPDFQSSMAWFDRRKKVTGILEKIPAFELLGLL